MVRSALIQTTGSVDKEENIVKHLELIEEAANQGSQITCLQELFFSPYFCQVQDAKWYSQAEPIPGPMTRRMQEVAKRHSMVLVVPLYEEEAPGIYYNTAVVIDADGTLLGKYRKTHIPHLPHFWEKFYFRPGNLGYPVFKT
ncbi:MAG: nitrilase-related carbon-nitrogen hydrolase, partial [Anaerolineae bacterium]